MTTPQGAGPLPGVGLTPVDFDPFGDAAPEPAAVPLSEAQREIWTAVQMGREASCAYNLCFVLRLSGDVSIEDLRSAVQTLFDRHEALRIRFDESGESQVVQPPSAVDLPVLDLRDRAAGDRSAALDAMLVDEVETPLDLVNGLPVRVQLVLDADDRCHLVVTAHHIAVDGASAEILFRDLAAAYAAARAKKTPSLPPAGAFSRFVQEDAENGRQEAALQYWLEQYRHSVPVLDLPVDRPRPPLKGYRGAVERVPLGEALSVEIRNAAARAGTTTVGYLLAAFYALLHRLTGQSDVVVGLPVSVREAASRATLVGHATNFLPIRLTVDGAEPFAEHLRRVRTALLDAQDHQSLTFGTLVRRLGLKRDPSRTPLVAATFNLDRGSIAPAFPDAEASIAMAPRRHLNFELEMNVRDTGRDYVVECSFDPDLIEAGTMRRWLAHYATLVTAVVADPGVPVERLPLLTEAEREEILTAWNDTRTEFPADALVHELFEACAERSPERPAIRFGETVVSYADLAERASSLARALRGQGIGRGQRVGLCLERGPDMVAALLGILETGAAYVPLDPALPRERLRFMAEDAQLALLVTTTSLVDAVGLADVASLLVDEHTDTGAREAAIDSPAGRERGDPGDPAYVIYTSGSTGKPKGVVLPHRAVVNFLTSMARTPGMQPSDRLVAVTTLSFDIAVLELLLPLTVGAEVVLADRDEAGDGDALRAILESSAATVMQATPATWRLLIDAGWNGSQAFRVLVGGEALPQDLAAQLVARAGEVWNMYGPTETTVWSTCWRVADPELGVSIGRPIANTTIYVLDERGEACPVGVPGEIYIGGDGLALGYLNRPELTAERFVANPFSGADGARLYRTGDLGRWLPGGTLEHLGRLDFQVKVRGFRIELGEIESVLVTHEAVKQAVVMARGTAPEDMRLVAYMLPEPGETATGSELRRFLRKGLPDYMVPNLFVELDHFPLTPSGKVDRKALPPPHDEDRHQDEAFAAPRTQIEQAIAAVWQELLKVERVSLRDNFFDLGGHSMLAAQMVARVARTHGYRIRPRSVTFETLEQIAAGVEAP